MTDQSLIIAELRLGTALDALNLAQTLYDYFPTRSAMRELESATAAFIAAQHVKDSIHASIQRAPDCRVCGQPCVTFIGKDGECSCLDAQLGAK